MNPSSRTTATYGAASDDLEHSRTGQAGSKKRHSSVALGAQLQKLHARLQSAVIQSCEHAKPNMVWVGLMASVGFPVYYVIWTVVFPQPYENLPLRLLGAAVGVPLLLVNHLPRWFSPYLPLYWLLGIFYTLPFFFTFMLLKSDVSVIWSMSTVVAAVLLALLINDWLMLTLVAVAGGGLAWICFHVTGGHLQGGVTSYLVQLPIYFFMLVGGSLFNYKAEVIKQEKLEAMAATSNTIAHELRTPLLGIRSGIAGVNRYLPQLLQGYELAQTNGLPVQHIRAAHYRELQTVLQRVEAETEYSNLVIDMLLINARRTHIATDDFAWVSMSECITTALSRYPFKSDGERSCVHWSPAQSFVFHGSTILMVHVLFNLLKNALASMSAAGKGDITIWITPTHGGANLHFRDTGQGIDPEILTHIFDRFYSTTMTEHGAGIGLAFCKKVMRSFGGTIRCSSRLGEFAEFVLYFPGVKSDENL